MDICLQIDILNVVKELIQQTNFEVCGFFL